MADLIKVTNENYFDTDVSMQYMGASQFKTFLDCEARGLAEAKGEWEREETTALLVGSYIDAHFEGTLDIFKAKHPEIFKKDGKLKADYIQAEDIIRRIENDELAMKYLSGEKQIVMTAEIEGVPFKIKIDSYHIGKAIVDQKIMKDFEPIWVAGRGKVNFVEAWGYDIQGAIYRAVVEKNTGLSLPFFIDAATKQDETDLAVIRVPDELLDSQLEVIKNLAPHFHEIKQGVIPAKRCEKCAYCRATKVLTRVQTLDEFDPEI